MKLPRAQHLSTEELTGQMLMPAVFIDYGNRHSQKFQHLVRLIKNFSVGGVIIFGGHPADILYTCEKLQSASKYPLLIGADLERGTGALFQQGTIFPHTLAWGAANDPYLIKSAASIMAKEAKALGINIIFAPVLDLVSEPNNPIINIRGFHQNPEKVADFAEFFITAAQTQRIACVAKHFPGHGRSCIDSHLALPHISEDPAVLDASDLIPFQQAISGGIKGLMIAHIQLNNNPLPASFREDVIQIKLRQKLGFKGVVFSDALNMKAIKQKMTLNQQIEFGIKAGIDIFLMPERIPLFFNMMVDFLQKNEDARKKAESCVERIFLLKKWLYSTRLPSSHPKRIYKFLNHPQHIEQSQKLAQKSITCVHQSPEFPFDFTKIKSCLHIIFTDFQITDQPLVEFQFQIKNFFEEVEIWQNPPLNKIKQPLKNTTDLIIFAVYSRTFGGHQSEFDWQRINQTLTILLKNNKPLAIVIFGNPFYLTKITSWEKSAVVLLTYSYVSSTQISAFKALTSFVPIKGKLPIHLSTSKGNLAGISISSKNYKIENTSLLSTDFHAVDQHIENAISQKIFPGAVLLTVVNHKVIVHRGYGRFYYISEIPDSRRGKNSTQKNPEILPDTVYDLASLTKVMATTPLILKLIEKNLLDFTEPLANFYSTIRKNPLGGATIADILSHQAGLKAWEPFYKKHLSKKQIIETILELPPEYEVGYRSVYSDLGFILLGDIIEKVTGINFSVCSRNYFFNPMGLDSFKFLKTDFLISQKSQNEGYQKRNLTQYPPTGFDLYRGRILAGEVNDTNCYILGGASGHAGLFGNAQDVAAVAQMFLNGGIYNSRRHFKHSTILKALTKYRPKISDRALGWDTVSKIKSSSGKYFSAQSFGHLAFTGPSLWVDPEKKMIVVFLCNRTQPDPENSKIDYFRPILHDLIFQTLQKNNVDFFI
jgi:beta-N-acetylhexosaminidase